MTVFLGSPEPGRHFHCHNSQLQVLIVALSFTFEDRYKLYFTLISDIL